MVNQIPFRTSKSETSGQVQRHQTHPSPPSLLPLRFHTLTNPSFPPTRPYRFSSSSLSCAYKSLNAQNLCFHIHANSRGVTQRILQLPLSALSVSPANPFLSYCCSLLQSLASFFAFVSFIFKHLQPLLPKIGGGDRGQ